MQVDISFKGLQDAFLGIFASFINFVIDQLADRVVDPLIRLVTYTPVPKRCTDSSIQKLSNCPQAEIGPAIIRPPATDSLFHASYELYWSQFFRASVILGVVLYFVVAGASTIPGMNFQSKQKRMKGGLLKFFISLLGLWPIMMFSLYMMSFLNRVAAPDPEKLVGAMASVLAVIGAASASPFAILTSLLGAIDVIVFAIAITLYLARIIYLIAIPGIAPLLLMFWSLDIPIVRGLAKSVLSGWIKVGLAPVLAGAFLSLAAEFIDVLLNQGGPLGTAMGAITAIATSVLIPVGTIASLYLGIQASVPQAASGMARTAQRRFRYTKMGDVAPDPIKDKVERAAKVPNQVTSAGAKKIAGTTLRSMEELGGATAAAGGTAVAASGAAASAVGSPRSSSLFSGGTGSDGGFLRGSSTGMGYSEEGFEKRLDRLSEMDSDQARNSEAMQEAIEMVDNVPGNDPASELNQLERIRRSSGASRQEVMERAERFSEGIQFNNARREKFREGNFESVPRPSDVVRANAPGKGDELSASDIVDDEQLDQTVLSASDIVDDEQLSQTELSASDIVDDEQLSQTELSASDIVDDEQLNGGSSVEETQSTGESTQAADYMDSSGGSNIMSEHDLTDPEVFDAYSDDQVGEGVGHVPSDWEPGED